MHSCITETILNNCHYSMTYIIYQYMFALRVCEQWQQENESIQQSESVQIKNPNPKKRWTVPSTKWSNGSTACCGNHASDKHNLSDVTQHFVKWHVQKLTVVISQWRTCWNNNTVNFFCFDNWSTAISWSNISWTDYSSHGHFVLRINVEILFYSEPSFDKLVGR